MSLEMHSRKAPQCFTKQYARLNLTKITAMRLHAIAVILTLQALFVYIQKKVGWIFYDEAVGDL